MLLVLLALPRAMAEPCDARALQQAVQDASPVAVVQPYLDLVACDQDAARDSGELVFGELLSGDRAIEVVRAGIALGLGEQARQWVAGLQSDERSREIAALGAACSGDPAVAAFLVESRQELGDAFWRDRWYRSLEGCRDPGIQAMLADEVAHPSKDRGRFFGILEVFARNLGTAAIPRLEELAGELRNEEELTYVVNAFADAAHVGAPDGQDPKATTAAIAAIQRIAPGLPVRAIEQARTTLEALGAHDEASRLAELRYADRMQDDGNLIYPVILAESATCRRGRKKLRVHLSTVLEAGERWPDQLETPVREALDAAWRLDLSDRCGGTGQVTMKLASEPVAGPNEAEAWLQKALKDATDGIDARVSVIREEPVVL